MTLFYEQPTQYYAYVKKTFTLKLLLLTTQTLVSNEDNGKQ